MNQAERCHQVANCPGLFVDAFKAFKRKITDPSSSFILTHYHGDHYNGLPRDSYVGPAKIHCTPVTSALLRSVHGVPKECIIEHAYGETWIHRWSMNGDTTSNKSAVAAALDGQAEVTFYDANHCPGAAIVLVQFPDNGKVHLHTGDMRYHDKMKEYPLLKKAAEERRLDLLYLDTTYSHPKHDFVPQGEAVELIASQVEQLLIAEEQHVSTLVLLSCYSIGKEKVLWECSSRTQKTIFVNEKKFKKLQCLEGHRAVEESSSIIDRCTQNENETNIHVIPMGLCGEMWPYFRPNYNECAKYAERLEKRYDRVVAFIPTGWANATNWNKKNAISKRKVDMDKIQNKEGGKESNRHIDVEVRLISYSEHSTFSELCSFVEFLKPRKVIPTVYSDEKDYIAIEARFKDMIDEKRAKQAFLNSMFLSPSYSQECKREWERTADKKWNKTQNLPLRSPSLKGGQKSNQGLGDMDAIVIDCCDENGDDEEGHPASILAKKQKTRVFTDQELATLISMGFAPRAAQIALEKSGGNVDGAIESILATNSASGSASFCASSKSASQPNQTNRKKKPSGSIAHFFSPNAK